MKYADSRDLVKELYSQSDIRLKDFAKEMGVSRATAWDRLNTTNKSVSVPVMAEMLRPLGYRLVVVKCGAKIIGEGYVIE